MVVKKKAPDDIEAQIERIAVIDCETDPFAKGRTVIRPFIWGYYNGAEYREFRETHALVEFLRERDEIVYAHNGGRFDFHFLDKFIDPFQPIMIINGRIAKMKMGQCELRDSYNILPVPLSAWDKQEFDYSKMEEDVREEHMTEIRDYLKSDCVFLYQMVTTFVRQYGMHLTQAGAAMKTWEKMSGMDAPKSTESYYKELHPYYFGGRVQCFEQGIGKVDFKVADINSAYPRAMLEKHPIGIMHSTFLTWKLPRVMAEIEKRGPGAVFVSLNAISKGALPWRGPDGGLYFPSDNVERYYHVTGWELLAAMETKTVIPKQVLMTHVFTQMTDFSDYILHFYNLRKESKAKGDKAGDLFSKLLMNSLYGKFASNPDQYSSYMNVPAEYGNLIGDEELSKRLVAEQGEKVLRKLDLGKYNFAGMLGIWALAEKPLEKMERRYYNIATSASITGFVRAFLWRTLCACERPLYCDTDSIAAVGFKDDVKFSGELGDWKHEGDFDFYALGGRKMYAFREKNTGEWKTASKGVRLTAEEIVTVAKGGSVIYEPLAPTFSVHGEPTIVNREVKATHKPIPKPEPKKSKKVVDPFGDIE